MRELTVWVVLVSFFLVTACGRVPEGQFVQDMNEREALDLLSQVPVTEEASGPVADTETVSVKGLEGVIQEAIQSGKVKLPSQARGAISASGNVDMTQLTTLLTLLSQGASVGQVAQGMIQSAQGDSTKAKFNIDTIAAILQAVAPIVASIAPQYAVVIQAVLTILPVIKMFIGLFKKPTAFIPASGYLSPA